MKIISKYKDYYDYLAGIYGEDPLVILDRRTGSKPFTFSEMDKVRLYVCDVYVEGLYKNGNFYYGKDVEQFEYVAPERNGRWWKRYRYRSETKAKEHYVITRDRYRIEQLTINVAPVPTDVNTRLGVPVLLRNPFSGKDDTYDISRYQEFPILRDLNLQSLIPPGQMWLMLTDFLSKKDPDNDTRDNRQKILDAGFDLKESFRGK